LLDFADVSEKDDDPKPPKKKRRRIGRFIRYALLLLIGVGIAVRIALPSVVRGYVNRTLGQHPQYDGRIGDVDLHLWRGAYTIKDVRIIKTSGNVPVPLFAAERVELATEWPAVLRGKLVGRIDLYAPELNFVDDEEESGDQTGGGGPWLEIIQELFPFRINSAQVHEGELHFRAFHTDPPVDMYLTELQATLSNLTNIHDEVTPMIATIEADALAMDDAKFEYRMKLDPTSYRPTFQLATRLVGLDVTKTNPLMRAYGDFEFEHGRFDLVIEIDAREGGMEGYVKPLFRNLQVFSLRQDVREGDPLNVFWEALVGTAAELLENQPRDQFGTVIPLEGDMSDPKTDLFAIVGNVLHNAFVRAYLPNLQGRADAIEATDFTPDPITGAGATSDRR
jgi:hypothetical protein